MQCNSCSKELLFVGFFEGGDGFMAEYYCDHCVRRKVSRIKTEFFNATRS